MLAPLHRRLGARFGKPVVERVAEELCSAIETPCLEQFLRANHAERIEQLRPDDVLSAFAAVQRHVRDARVIPARRSRNERRILVIGMRPRVKHARRRLQALQELCEAGGARVVDRADLRPSAQYED